MVSEASKKPCTAIGCRAEQPFDPQPEDAPPGADELKLPAVEIGVPGPPPFNQNDGERIADPESADRDQYAENLGIRAELCNALSQGILRYDRRRRLHSLG